MIISKRASRTKKEALLLFFRVFHHTFQGQRQLLHPYHSIYTRLAYLRRLHSPLCLQEPCISYITRCFFRHSQDNMAHHMASTLSCTPYLLLSSGYHSRPHPFRTRTICARLFLSKESPYQYSSLPRSLDN